MLNGLCKRRFAYPFISSYKLNSSPIISFTSIRKTVIVVYVWLTEAWIAFYSWIPFICNYLNRTVYANQSNAGFIPIISNLVAFCLNANRRHLRAVRIRSQLSDEYRYLVEKRFSTVTSLQTSLLLIHSHEIFEVLYSLNGISCETQITRPAEHINFSFCTFHFAPCIVSINICIFHLIEKVLIRISRGKYVYWTLASAHEHKPI